MSDAAKSPEVHRTTLRLETVEGARMRFGADVGGHPLVLDTGPEAEGPSPFRLLQAALGGCTAMDVISILRKKRQAVTGYEVEIVGERRMDQHPRVYTSLEVVHRVRGRGLNPAAVAEAIELSDTKYCGVHAMLEKVATITSRFEITEG